MSCDNVALTNNAATGDSLGIELLQAIEKAPLLPMKPAR
jgi:hypothetical protein